MTMSTTTSLKTSRNELFSTPFDIVELTECLTIIRQHYTRQFAYVVTPNVDHVVRINNSKLQLAEVYNNALLSICDSRIIRILAYICSKNIPEVITGSDLTRLMFEKVIVPGDSITIIGGHKRTIENLSTCYNLKNLYHYNPPMGFLQSEKEIISCLEFVENHPSRYIFFAVGSPQQEILAYRIYKREKSTGLGFCIGASIDFLTGIEKRAPKFVQQLALEWLFRLLQNPKRLWKRYLVQDIKIFPIFFRCLWRKLTE